jgi:hypothetical protein
LTYLYVARSRPPEARNENQKQNKTKGTRHNKKKWRPFRSGCFRFYRANSGTTTVLLFITRTLQAIPFPLAPTRNGRLSGKPQGKDNIKVNPGEMGCEQMRWIEMAQEMLWFWCWTARTLYALQQLMEHSYF